MSTFSIDLEGFETMTKTEANVAIDKTFTPAPMVRLSDIEVVHYWPSVKTSGEDWYGVYPSLAVAERAIMRIAREFWSRDAALPAMPDDVWEAVRLLREHDLIYITHIDDYDMGTDFWSEGRPAASS